MSQGKFYKHLYFKVLVAIAVGVALGHFYPTLGAQMKPFGDGFIKLIKMLIAPIIFCTVVVGIASMENLKRSAGWGSWRLFTSRSSVPWRSLSASWW